MRRVLLLLCLTVLALAAPAAQTSQKVTVPIEYHTLDNGLKVVLSRDT